MKYLIIDDQKEFAQDLSNRLNEKVEVILVQAELSSIAQSIFKKTKNNTGSIILINANLISKESRSKNEGITLLKWIRLKECYNHCILYSFSNPLCIAKADPHNSIVFSKGVSFIRLPFSTEELAAILTIEPASRENLLPYFRLEVDLVKIRHELANIWAIYRMKEVIGIEKMEENKNFRIEILKYLSADYSKTSGVNNESLLNQIRTFKAKGKKIFYYDDLADDWAIPLKILFGDKNIEIISAKTVNQDELLKRIQNEKPGCLLLDLRLANEKDVLDVLEYSGGKVLHEVKKRFFTLPVIMFTATNKAESVRRLISAGAEYVWTKEGIDDGISNKRTLENTINLISEVSKALSKFKNSTYECIYETEIKYNNVRSSIVHNGTWNFPLKRYNIYIDTNYLIDVVKKGALHLFYEFLLKKPKNWRIKIHEDVLREILAISQQDETFINPNSRYDRNNPFRVPVCRFLLEKIFEWRQLGLISIEEIGGQDSTIDEIVKLNLPDLPETLSFEKQIEEKTSFWKRFFISLEENNLNQLDRINSKVSEINSTIDKIKNSIQKLPNFEKLKLHADDTFINTIPKDLELGNVILVTDDNRCAHDVGTYFLIDKQKFTVGKVQEYRIDNTKKSAPCIVETSSNNSTNTYKHLRFLEINNIIKEWCKEDIVAVGDKRDGIVTGFLPSKQNPAFFSGAFILLKENKTGFLHVNSLGTLNKTANKVNDISGILCQGDSVRVEITEILKDGKISLKGINKNSP